MHGHVAAVRVSAAGAECLEALGVRKEVSKDHGLWETSR